ncbi:competence/damage-inducible protein A [Paenibacillus eucommiae]|uniref:Putative competence-damage inducible protein n=1 Tax=Paenibacillus eucommiae TaxID=1355755 RepID=A0ABS4IUL6_9BACL|nr:competence/damage-inducible protein A [Paenibacillus eucommiae]MBP1991264.1 nicotinamide-nucleotide amidase [Paenibacillus eucommiae]
MKAEIIAIGTELLLGQIVNTNAQFLAQECAALGIDIYYQTVVGDNASRLLDSFKLAASRADVVICTGGLGPTQDDLTKDVLSDYIGQALFIHQPSMDTITKLFQNRETPMVETNARQALLFENSDPLQNDVGLAVGAALTFEGTHFIVLPGPPKEMKPMFTRHATPWLKAVMTDEVPLYSKMLKFAGIGESSLEHELIDMIDAQTDPTIAPYAKEAEVTIRLTTRAHTPEEGEPKLASTEAEIRKRLGQHLYAVKDVPIEHVVLELLKEKNQTLSVAESCSGGLLSDLLTTEPGSSEVFKGGVVCYSNALKHQLLDIPMDMLEGPGAPGAISEETALLLAENLQKITGTDYALSITGVAGPSLSEGKPIGLVYIGLVGKESIRITKKLQISGTRDSIKWRSSKDALYQLWKQLINN